MSRYERTCLLLALALSTCCACCGAEEISVTGLAEPSLAAFDQLMLSFIRDHDVPGAALAIARHGRIVYARGFGYADVEKHQPVEPDSLFRIASISKPFTAAAILQLKERGKLSLDDHPFEMLGLTPHLEAGAMPDPRLKQITIRELLHHTGGFDRAASIDPMFRSIIIAKSLAEPAPASPTAIIRYMMVPAPRFRSGHARSLFEFRLLRPGRGDREGFGHARRVVRPTGNTEPVGDSHHAAGPYAGKRSCRRGSQILPPAATGRWRVSLATVKWCRLLTADGASNRWTLTADGSRPLPTW